MVEKKQNKFINQLLGLLLPFLVVIFIGGWYVYVNGRMQTSADMEGIAPKDGVVDVREYSLDEKVYHLVNDWDYFPGKLYTPEDFVDEANAPVKALPNEKDMNLGSYRVRIIAKPHMYLMLASYTIDYSMRVFVDGEEVLNVGYVTDAPETTIHDGHFVTIPFYTGEGETEIIYQYANYMHKDGGFIQSTTIGTPEQIANFVRNTTLYSLFTGGGLIFLAFYFLLYAAYQRNREYGVLALCCLLMAFRNSHFINEFLRPDGFPFELHYRIFIYTVSTIPAMGIFVPAAYFPKVMNKWFERLFMSLCAVSIILHFTIPTESLVALCHICYYFSAAFLPIIIFLFIRYYWKKRKIERTEVLTIITIVLLYWSMIFESLHTGNNSLIAHFGTTPFMMLICILSLSIATNVKITRRMELLTEEQHKNEVLGQMNAMNRDFLQTVAHELKTPLAVISGYAQLTQMQIEKDKLSPQAPERLQTIRSEADRLGAMVANLMAFTYGQVSEAELHMVDPAELIKNAALIGEPICEKKGNKLKSSCTSKSMAHGNFELLLQVFINMIVNANRHTQDGELELEAHDVDRYIAFTIKDTGSGIAPEVAEHIFERGYSADGGSGLGLAICMDTVKMHGGELKLLSTGPEGTSFEILIPQEAEK
ncbi:MAG: hypothetical protein IKX10_00385 [Lachnospiraceae bacterium]|nr:hypothetical protein [Lachnospiraceae bacterium]